MSNTNITISEDRKAYLTDRLTKRQTYKAQIKALEALCEEIDVEMKTLPQAEKAYVFGPFTVFWKKITKNKHSMDWIKQHEPAAYAKSAYSVEEDYYAIK